MTMRALAQGIGAVANTTVRKITPDMASRWLEAMAYEHQRTVRKHHVEYLAEEMRRSNFRQFTPIQICSYNGQQLLIDGQHRLNAVISSGIPQVFTVIETQSESADEIAWTYGNTDIGMKRTGGDLYSALELSQKFDLAKYDVGYLSAAVTFLWSGCTRTNAAARPHRSDVVECMERYSSHMRSYVSLITGCDKSLQGVTRRAATVSIALLSLRYAKPHAEKRGDPDVLDFWRGVVFDDGIPLGDPRKVANRHLLTSGMNGGASNSRLAATVVTAAYSARFLASCFNAYMSRRDLKQAKVFDALAPVNLYGTPNDSAEWRK